MSQLWREFYYRISLGGGLAALLLINFGFSGDLAHLTSALKPDDLFPAPIAAACEAREKAPSPLKVAKPTWCQASAQEQNLDKGKSKNIF